jgi:ketosteroid isomerase-like protein
MTVQDGVLDLAQRWAAAEEKNDAGALDELLAGAFAGVGPFGFILTRDQWLARFANGLVNRSFAVTDLQVRGFGTAAVGIGVLAQETSWQGSDNSGRFRLTLVAVQEGEGWRLAHVHIGPLQMPPGGAA